MGNAVGATGDHLDGERAVGTFRQGGSLGECGHVILVGCGVGSPVGSAVGSFEGSVVGDTVGSPVGSAVGSWDGSWFPHNGGLELGWLHSFCISDAFLFRDGDLRLLTCLELPNTVSKLLTRTIQRNNLDIYLINNDKHESISKQSVII